MNGWIGVDLDGTLARYDKWISIEHIGEPIEPMVKRVKEWLREGKEVKIFTARVSFSPNRDVEHVRSIIRDWCFKHIGYVLEITNVKDFGMIELWDDRCIQVIPNMGIPVTRSFNTDIVLRNEFPNG